MNLKTAYTALRHFRSSDAEVAVAVVGKANMVASRTAANAAEAMSFVPLADVTTQIYLSGASEANTAICGSFLPKMPSRAGALLLWQCRRTVCNFVLFHSWWPDL